MAADMCTADVPREEGRASTYGMETPLGSLIGARGRPHGNTVDSAMGRFKGRRPSR